MKLNNLTSDVLAVLTGEREVEDESLVLIRAVLEEPDIRTVTPEIARRVRTRMKQATRLYDKALADAGLGPKGIIVLSPRAQLAANRRSN